MFRFIYRTFLNGLALIVPPVLAIYLFVWLGVSAEKALSPLMIKYLGAEWYRPGYAVALGFLLVFMAGLLVRLWIFRKIRDLIEGILKHIPLINSVYGGIRDFFGFLAQDKKDSARRVVIVNMGTPAIELVGLVTNEDLQGFPGGTDDKIAVYLQMSYQVGGYTILVPRSMVTPIDMSVEDAMRFVLTAGVSRRK
ncbi:MAG: DUF502 domain-containing protein [Deltaproteobacteria bacterium]|nr:DUF502 domain-containing protein [Deltaproteobacteria bacterium]